MRGVNCEIVTSAEQVSSTRGDAGVTLPEGIARPAQWRERELPTVGEHAFCDEWHKGRDHPAGDTPPLARA